MALIFDSVNDRISSSSGPVGFPGRIDTPASTTGTAGFRLPHGTAPTSPVDGDVWTTTAGIYVRVNGTTLGPFPSYAENTWTPTDASGASLSITVDNARYIKVGKLVTITLGSISWPSNASTADAKIGGLPFTSATGGTTCSGGVFAFASPYPNSNYAPIPVLLNPNSTQLLVYDPVNGVGMQNQSLSTTALYGLSMTYVASA